MIKVGETIKTKPELDANSCWRAMQSRQPDTSGVVSVIYSGGESLPEWGDNGPAAVVVQHAHGTATYAPWELEA